MNHPAGFPRLTFCGAAGTVTGSRYLIETGKEKILLDAGLFQGLKALRLRNWEDPPFDPSELTAVVVSHAHLDHSGYLPLLTRRGFTGPVYCTSATEDLLQILLPDSAHLQSEQASHANRHRYSKHSPALALYELEDAAHALSLIQPRSFGQSFEAAEGITVNFKHAAHILGAAIVEMVIQAGNGRKCRLVFSGDLGRRGQPLLRDPENVESADVLLMESTYGNRFHPENVREELVRVITEAVKRGGALIIPAFAVGRTQELIWMIRELEDQRKIPVLQVFLDSPMGADAVKVYARHFNELDHEARSFHQEPQRAFMTTDFHVLKTREESKKLYDVSGTFILISSSGMATGGRILHHLARRLSDRRTTVLLTGFQAAGTRGRTLEEGAEFVKIHGALIPVRACVEKIDGLSAHADQNDILRWLGGFKKAPAKTFIVHGEPAASEALAEAVRSKLQWPEVRPAMDGETVLL